MDLTDDLEETLYWNPKLDPDIDEVVVAKVAQNRGCETMSACIPPSCSLPDYTLTKIVHDGGSSASSVGIIEEAFHSGSNLSPEASTTNGVSLPVDEAQHVCMEMMEHGELLKGAIVENQSKDALSETASFGGGKGWPTLIGTELCGESRRLWVPDLKPKGNRSRSGQGTPVSNLADPHWLVRSSVNTSRDNLENNAAPDGPFPGIVEQRSSSGSNDPFPSFGPMDRMDVSFRPGTPNIFLQAAAQDPCKSGQATNPCPVAAVPSVGVADRVVPPQERPGDSPQVNNTLEPIGTMLVGPATSERVRTVCRQPRPKAMQQKSF